MEQCGVLQLVTFLVSGGRECLLGYLFNLCFGELIFQTVGLLFVVTCWALLNFVNVCSFPSSDLVGTWPIVFVPPLACATPSLNLSPSYI